VDYFLLYQFGTVIDISILDTVLVTNVGEATEFASAYIAPTVVVLFLIGALLVNFVAYVAARLLGRYVLGATIIRLCAALGVTFLVVNVVLILFFHMSVHISTPMHHSIARVLWEYGRLTHETHLGNLVHICQDVKAVRRQEGPLKMIVIIGESHSVYHTSLYGYEKETYPLMKDRERNGELFVFQNAVTTNDVTALVMGSVYSLDSMGINFNEYPLFPAVFKTAGFRTTLYDNEYLADESLNFMSNSTLSNLLYDQRNTTYYEYDGDMIKDADLTNDSLALYIFHLTGHHVRYDKRYPQSFAKFKVSDYGGNYSDTQKEDIAAYDNACLYNDYIINEVIRMFEDDNAVLVYFSDHGEELYEVRDFRGHGSAKSSPDIRYQLRVPFWVWLSDKYRNQYPLVVDKIRRALDLHVKTDDMPFFLIDLADIDTEWMKHDRSFITEGSYHGWNNYREMIISQDGFNTNEGGTLRQFSQETE
jgi:heptose-I-phosphate ethanolaminephosphotransferase